MKRDELLPKYLRLPWGSPHAIDYARRRFLKRAGMTAVGAGVLAAMGSFPTEALASGSVKLPEMTSIPEKLKGTGEVRVVSYGGAFQAAQREAYFKPFERLSGIKVIESEGPDPAKVKAMVDTGTVQWDVGEFDWADILQLEHKGDYWEPIDYSLVDTANIDAAYRHKYALAMLPYGQVISYRTDAFGGRKPRNWVDFWDQHKFPGPRTMISGNGGLTPDLEAAIMATGVSRKDVYPIDIDKAFASLTKIKPHIVKWWEAGAIPAQMISDQEVVMAEAWNGRIAAVQAKGVPVGIAWGQGLLRTDTWAVPKGAPNAENAMKFTAFITLPISQARLSMLIPYGFVNDKAVNYIPKKRLEMLPTAPDIKSQMLIYDSRWWANHRDKVLDKWNSWLLS